MTYNKESDCNIFVRAVNSQLSTVCVASAHYELPVFALNEILNK